MDFKDMPVTTSTLSFRGSEDSSAPIFHILDLDGKIAKPSDFSGGESSTELMVSPNGDALYRPLAEDESSIISRDVAERMMTSMIAHNTMDKIMLEAQRQGRISFYMSMFGEESAVIGAAAGLASNDELFMQYRESGLLTYRGYTIPQFVAQCMGNSECDLKGRQMPIHYGSVKLHAQVVSSPLATQIPHGAGAGYAFRLENAALLKQAPPGTDIAAMPDARICATFFGEGASSEGDFHAGLNFAATMGSHTLFFVRNNGYAISTPTHSQYVGDGVLGRAIGYGMPSARIDGQDAVAVYYTVRKAREMILRTNKPVFIEAMTYRVSHHSTSDDSTAYRTKDEIGHFADLFSPIERFEKFLLERNWWNSEKSAEIMEKTRKELLSELRRQESIPPWPVSTLCDDVYEVMPEDLKKQQKELTEHYQRFKDKYDQEKL
ncbi:2-oxoisovalerate dehydrogenase E1 component, alpha subunit [Strigomonas culicis]|nr:2-oxoisovalerate dehydrogenase E1 component, alpha subunit [Strigomonas culicis]|eukprot:EPY33687.1 2-oxoisovalerate dehydrogenase E1 component, alpha subunit [Strigomonas culicis]